MSDLLYEKNEGVVTITLNRAERRNAISPEMMVRLGEAWVDFQQDEALRVAILTGAGSEAFCVGGDLKLLIPLFTGARKPENEWDERLMANLSFTMTSLLKGFELYKPVVAAVNGVATAGGCEILQATDIRIAARGAKFGLAEARRGLVPGGGSLVRLARQIPYCKAMEILLLGDLVSAEEACRMGLINEVVEPEELLPRAQAIAARLVENGPFALRKIKEAVLRTSGVPLKEAFEIENQIAGEVMASADAREGPRAFIEKRPPKWLGR
jgi:enoyl-CoA hydratase